MKNFWQFLTKAKIWEHLIPFALLLLLANGYLLANSDAIWLSLYESGVGSFDATVFIWSAFILVNICCFLGYGLSQISLYTIKILFMFGQTQPEIRRPARQLSSSLM